MPQKLWGDMKPVVSVKELMRDLIDPLADNIFEAVAVIKDKNCVPLLATKFLADLMPSNSRLTRSPRSS